MPAPDALGHREKEKHGLKEQLEYRGASPRTCQTAGELLKLSLGQRGCPAPQFVFPLNSMDGSRVWAPEPADHLSAPWAPSPASPSCGTKAAPAQPALPHTCKGSLTTTAARRQTVETPNPRSFGSGRLERALLASSTPGPPGLCLLRVQLPHQYAPLQSSPETPDPCPSSFQVAHPEQTTQQPHPIPPRFQPAHQGTPCAEHPGTPQLWS